MSGMKFKTSLRPPAMSFVFIASIPPTARTANTARMITMLILTTNWNTSVTSTPHNPDSVEAPGQGVEHHRQQARRHEAPPQPVAVDPVARHEARHDERRVRGEGCRDHRCAREPPGDVAPGEEELRRALAGAGFVVEPDPDGACDVQ